MLALLHWYKDWSSGYRVMSAFFLGRRWCACTPIYLFDGPHYIDDLLVSKLAARQKKSSATNYQ